MTRYIAAPFWWCVALVLMSLAVLVYVVAIAAIAGLAWFVAKALTSGI